MNATKRNGHARLLLAALAAGVFGVAAVMSGTVSAAGSASDADRAFVAKVSQGGAYEVAAGKVAAERGQTPVARNFGLMEVHDHEGVGANLKRIAAQTGVPIDPAMNAEFSGRLAKLKTVPAAQFDAAYFADMKQIHNKDEGLFAQESNDGTAAYKDFAHQTAVLVKAHLGWLDSL